MSESQIQTETCDACTAEAFTACDGCDEGFCRDHLDRVAFDTFLCGSCGAR